jgi:hypothetical protein
VYPGRLLVPFNGRLLVPFNLPTGAKVLQAELDPVESLPGVDPGAKGEVDGGCVGGEEVAEAEADDVERDVIVGAGLKPAPTPSLR